jgi:hypothetical protein
MNLLLWWSAFFLWLWAPGCAKSAKSEAYYDYAPSPTTGSGGGYGYGGAYDEAERSDAPAAAREEMDYKADRGGGGRAAKSQPAPPPPPPPPTTPGAPPADDGNQQPVSTPGPTPAARMVHYDGWMQLRVANPRETLEAAIELAEGLGGRTERLAGNTVTLRVPVEKFDESWKQLLALGDVAAKSVRADDVTEAFTALDLRAETLRATQKRLVVLLAKAKDEQEKLQLLAELTRVRTELDALESQLRTLSDLASMSRITLEAVAREAFQAQGGRPTLAGFEWIAALSPFRRQWWDDDHRVDLPVPEGLVSLSTKGPFVAESADGTVIWTMRVPNDPVGSGSFWLGAIQDRLATEFSEPQPSRIRGWECLSLLEPGAEEPYRWQICVQPSGNKLHVVQVFYPSQAQFERYGAAVEASLSAGGES